jgi:hypothetical protein
MPGRTHASLHRADGRLIRVAGDQGSEGEAAVRDRQGRQSVRHRRHLGETGSTSPRASGYARLRSSRASPPHSDSGRDRGAKTAISQNRIRAIAPRQLNVKELSKVARSTARNDPPTIYEHHPQELVPLETKPVWCPCNASEFFYASQTSERIKSHPVACTHQIGGSIMTIGSATPLPRATDLRKCLSVSRVELMLAIEDQFAGVEITDDDIEQIQLAGDLIRHLNAKAGQ